jgi:Papain family cysteine protease
MANAIPGGFLNTAPRLAVQSPHLNAVPTFGGAPGFGGAAPVEQAPVLNAVPVLTAPPQPAVPMPGMAAAYPGAAPQPNYGTATGHAAPPGFGGHPGHPLPTAPAAPPAPPPPVVARLGAAPVVVPQPPPPPPAPPEPPPYHTPASTNRRYLYRTPPAALASAPRHRAQPSTMVPPSCDLRGLFLPVRDQGDGDGRGYAVAAWCEAAYASAAQALPPGYFSPAFIADRARAASGGGVLRGSSVAEELVVVASAGVPPEAFYPAELRGQPLAAGVLSHEHEATDMVALGFRVANPFQVDFTDGGNSIKDVLSKQVPVVVAFLATASFESPTEGLLALPIRGDGILGGHAVVLVGYDATGWIVRNSHGEAWGDRGYATMPYGYEGWWTEAWAASRAA